MAALQVQDVKTRVKRTFGDEAGVQVTDADILMWINDAQRNIVRDNDNVLPTVGTANVVAGQNNYTLPSDLYRVHTVKWNGYNLKSLSWQDFNTKFQGWESTDSLYSQGQPTFYTLWQSSFYLFPTPSSALTSGLKIYYTRRPVDRVNDTDVLDTPEEYNDAVVNYVLQKCYELDEDWTGAGNKASEVTADLNSLKIQEQWRDEESYPSIRVMPEDM
jgi:hypothetical protein